MEEKTMTGTKKVACIGDSITWGFTIIGRARHSYPAVLQSLLGEEYLVRNFGYNDAAARIDSDTPYVRKGVYRRALKFDPDIAVVMLGSNDTKRRNWDPAKFREGYGTIIDSIIKLPSAPKVYLVTPPHIYKKLGLHALGLSEQTMTEGVIPAIREMASERDLEVIEVNAVLASPELFNDGVHPGRSGAGMIAEAVCGKIQGKANSPAQE